MAESTSETPSTPRPASGTPTISTHVLDAQAGQPAAGVHVILYKLGEDERPIRLTQALTDHDGRIRDLLERPMSPGVYRLEFNLAGPRGNGGSVVAGAAGSAGSAGGGSVVAGAAGSAAVAPDERFFRRMTLDLRIDDVTRSYHVPLLLAPFSMTTYRGS